MALPDSSTVPEERFAAFRHGSFTLYWLSRFFGTFATEVVSVAVAWQVYSITRSQFDLGLIGLVQFMPSLLLVLVTGTIADRVGRRLIMGLSVSLEACCAATLLFFSLQGSMSVLPIFGVLVAFGVARAFFGPASAALVANLVPTEDFANAVAWNSSAGQMASIVGPVAGGLLFGVSAEAAYGTAAVLLACSVLLAFAIPKPPQVIDTREKPTLSSMLAGFRYIWKEKIVLGAISLDLFAVLVSGAVMLLPVYASDILEVGPWGLGLLRAAPSIGAILVAVWLAGHSIRDHAGRILLTFVALFGVVTIVFGLSTLTWLSILALALVGATDMVSVYIRETLIQLWTPDVVRGRVNAVNMVFVGASNELGAFRAGSMAALIGTVPAVVVGGVGAIAVAGIWAWAFPDLKNARHLDGRA